MKQYIVCAANRNELTGLIICGARHWDDIMVAQANASGDTGDWTDDPWDQGFIDQYGKFLSREEAAQIIKDNAQELHGELAYQQDTVNYLFSEHLY